MGEVTVRSVAPTAAASPAGSWDSSLAHKGFLRAKLHLLKGGINLFELFLSDKINPLKAAAVLSF